MKKPRIGICSWCIDRHDVLPAIQVAGGELDVRVVQLGFFTAAALEQAKADTIRETARAAKVSLAGVFIGFEGEDYSSIDRIAATGGYAPDDLYAERLVLTRDAASLAASLGCPCVAVHAGTMPSDHTSPLHIKLVHRTRDVADVLAEHGVRLLLETGRESIDTLLGFMAGVDRENVGVNFDPGNLVIYGTDEPADAVAKVSGRVDIVHVKDAKRSARPGIDYGQPMPLGTGDAQIPRVLGKLRATGYDGPLLVEIPARGSDLQRLRGAIDYLHSLLD
jgi:sugar phosphate isomerase/epimerase